MERAKEGRGSKGTREKGSGGGTQVPSKPHLCPPQHPIEPHPSPIPPNLQTRSNHALEGARKVAREERREERK